jgi:signal peptidase I
MKKKISSEDNRDKSHTAKPSVVREWVESIVVALVLALVIRTFIIQAFKIPTGSMRPTLIEGDRILVSKFRYGPKVPFTHYRLAGFTKPQWGDVVVFVYPEDPSKDFIKRLIATGGETVEIKKGHIYVNGKALEDLPFKGIYYYNRGEYGDTGQKIKVEENHYFVLGDNSASSRDSRYWGFVPEKSVIGRAELIYWPLNRIRMVK